MISTRSLSVALSFAKERGESYGFSVFGCLWYVGPINKLKEIGVIDPITPSTV